MLYKQSQTFAFSEIFFSSPYDNSQCLLPYKISSFVIPSWCFRSFPLTSKMISSCHAKGSLFNFFCHSLCCSYLQVAPLTLTHLTLKYFPRQHFTPWQDSAVTSQNNTILNNFLYNWLGAHFLWHCFSVSWLFPIRPLSSSF